MRGNKAREYVRPLENSMPNATPRYGVGTIELEQSTGSSHAFVERVANTKLQIDLRKPADGGSCAVKLRRRQRRQAKSYR